MVRERNGEGGWTEFCKIKINSHCKKVLSDNFQDVIGFSCGPNLCCKRQIGHWAVGAVNWRPPITNYAFSYPQTPLESSRLRRSWCSPPHPPFKNPPLKSTVISLGNPLFWKIVKKIPMNLFPFTRSNRNNHTVPCIWIIPKAQSMFLYELRGAEFCLR